MDDMAERVDVICARVLDMLEARLFDDEAPGDVQSLLKVVQLVGELSKLQVGKLGGIQIVLEGDLADYAK